MFVPLKTAVIGGGIEGISIIKYLQNHGYKKITLCDKNASYDKKNLPKNLTFCLGKNYLKNLKYFDLVFRSPGIPVLSKEIQEALKKGAKITSAIKFFFNKCPCKIIGITGTKGKGTTSTLIYEILKNAGKDVYLGGNIGLPPLDFLDKLTTKSYVVLELSSFQLQDIKKSPKIAVVLNITSEHLDYHSSVKEYREAKKNIIKYQTFKDYVIANKDYQVPLSFLSESKAKRFTVSTKGKVFKGAYVYKNKIYLKIRNQPRLILKKDKIKLPGPHNLENVLPAVAAAGIMRIKPEIIKKTLKEFKGLPHRLEDAGIVNGIKFINDSFSTTPETAIAAINAFESPIVLILGGSEKFSDFKELGEKIVARTNVKVVILMGETKHRIEKAILEANNKVKNRKTPLKIIKAKNFQQAFLSAYSNAQKGDIVLLSPACASFGLFKNYKHRGESFKEAVKKLK
jgi:UDP-N-acetylmuramoylalanine--D-glutamate ligase